MKYQKIKMDSDQSVIRETNDNLPNRGLTDINTKT